MTKTVQRLEFDLFTLAKAFQIVVRLIRMDRLMGAAEQIKIMR